MICEPVFISSCAVQSHGLCSTRSHMACDGSQRQFVRFTVSLACLDGCACVASRQVNARYTASDLSTTLISSTALVLFIKHTLLMCL